MALLGRISVSYRFVLVLVIGLVFQAGISVTALLFLKDSLRQDRVNEVKHLLETAYSTVAFFHDQASKGVMTDSEARNAAAAAIRALHYDGTNYFCIWDLTGTGVAHGANPTLEGKTFVNTPDAAKNPIVADMVGKVLAAANSDAHEGMSVYRIPKFGQKTPLEKIAYSKLFAPWGWSITTGAYMDDIEHTFWTRALWVLVISIVLTAVAALVTFYLGRDLARAMSRLSARVTGVARGELEDDIPEVQRRDEVGAMARALLVLRDTSREAAELRLDQLTGLPTRKLLMDRLQQAKILTARDNAYGSVMLIDVDNFKSLNDTHGHDIGDALLKAVAQRLSTCVRDLDTAARLGGDEFVVVFVSVGKTESEAAALIESLGAKILAVLAQPYHLGSLTYLSTVSIGMTLFHGVEGSGEELLKQADLAMYKSKDSGRNACRFFDIHMQTTVLERATLERELRQALAERQFEVHYQPQVTASGALIGAEALVRWNHPTRGTVMPNEFIPLAEETGLILPLGQWVLQMACEQLASWASWPQAATCRMAVNVSARQFQQPDFVDQVVATLERTGAPAQQLVLELTESLLVRDVEDVIRKMTFLKAMGVRFALDDFGIGYSSMYYLKRLPLDQLKIDCSFVRHILTDRDDAAIAGMIVTLAQTLQLEVVAEGIETAAQRDFLVAAGCHVYQGNFFSRPRPPRDFEKLSFEPNLTALSYAPAIG